MDQKVQEMREHQINSDSRLRAKVEYSVYVHVNTPTAVRSFDILFVSYFQIFKD